MDVETILLELILTHRQTSNLPFVNKLEPSIVSNLSHTVQLTANISKPKNNQTMFDLYYTYSMHDM